MKMCECGCGLPAPIALKTRVNRGWIKGKPLRFISGHNIKLQVPYPRPSLNMRFWSKVDKRGPVLGPKLGRCWMWTGARDKDGYGQIYYKRKQHKAHRVAWFVATGEWPQPCALHKCDNTSCVRFFHLTQGTYKENTADMDAKGRRSKHIPNPKLTENEVREVRGLYAGGTYTHKELANMYSISRSNVSLLIRGLTWKFILPKEEKNEPIQTGN
jgi:hypothetical protein